jgi:cytoskeleton protein RodZ
LVYTQNKLPAIRQEAFKNAREALGLSVQDLSQMSCYSVRQIEQIENGESSSFYGAQVKFTAAKKVAGLLKLSEENAFDFGEPTPVKKTETPKNESPEAQGQSAASSSVSQTTPEQESVPVKSAPEKSIPKQKSLKLEALSSASVKASQPTEKDCFVVSDCSSVGIFNCESAPTLFSRTR